MQLHSLKILQKISPNRLYLPKAFKALKGFGKVLLNAASDWKAVD